MGDTGRDLFHLRGLAGGDKCLWFPAQAVS